MGLLKTIGKAAARRMINNAVDYAKRKGATKTTCPDGTRHQWTKWFNEEHPNTGVIHGPGSHVVWHCAKCGYVKR